MANELVIASLEMQITDALLELAEKLAKRGEEFLEERENTRRFKEAIGSKTPTADNTVFYSSKNVACRDALNAMRGANIPCVLLANDTNNTVLIAVPKSMQTEADRYIAKYNDTQCTEVSWRNFMERHQGEQVVKIPGLTDSGVEVFRNGMVDTNVEYCVRRNNDGQSTIIVLQQDEEKINPVALNAIAMQMSDFAPRLDAINERKLSVSLEALSDTKGTNRDVIFGDIGSVDNGYYRVHNGMLLFVKDGESEIIADSSDKDFAAIIRNIVREMKVPIAITMDSDRASQIGGRSLEGIASKEEIARAKASLALSEGINGRVADAKILAAQIYALALNENNGYDNPEKIMALNDVVAVAETCGDEGRLLAEKFRDLHLSSNEKIEVIDFIRNVASQLFGERIYAEVTVNEMDIDRIGHIIEATENYIEDDRTEDIIDQSNPGGTNLG